MRNFVTENEKNIIRNEVMPEIEWIPSYKFKGNRWLILLFIPLVPILYLTIAAPCVGIYSILTDASPFWGVVIASTVFGPILSWLIIRMLYNGYQDKKSFQLRYDEFEKSNISVCIVSKNGRYGLCRIRSGKELIEPIYITIIRNKHMYKLCNEDGEWGIYNVENNKVIVPCNYDRIEYDQFLSNIKAYQGSNCHLYASNGARKA